MIDKETLDKLVVNLSSIKDIFKRYGYECPSIFKPLSFSDAKKLNFVAVPNFEGAINLFDMSELEEELSKILNCKILFFPENRINEDCKEAVMKSKILLTEENVGDIKVFFHETLKVKNETMVNKNLFLNKHRNTEDKVVTKEDIVEYLKKDVNIWSAVEKSPDILSDVMNSLKLVGTGIR